MLVVKLLSPVITLSTTPSTTPPRSVMDNDMLSMPNCAKLNNSWLWLIPSLLISRHIRNSLNLSSLESSSPSPSVSNARRPSRSVLAPAKSPTNEISEKSLIIPSRLRSNAKIPSSGPTQPVRSLSPSPSISKNVVLL